jgi:radical SAM protein with 4Fe4S-binding SPASM domain
MLEYNGKQVTIMSCSDCNANCEHCYISYTGNLTGKELLKLCNVLHKKYKIIINGTEVLLHPDYFEALTISDQNRILTNGIIIYNNPKILDDIKRTGISTIAMSYHFDSDVSHISHEMLEKTINIIQKANMNVELMCTITNDNYNQLETICEKVLSLGVHTIRFFNCLNTGKCEENVNELCLSDNQILDFFKQLKCIRAKYDKNILKIKRNGLFGADKNNINCNFCCNAGIDEVVITPNLNVYPCIFMTKPGFEIGKYINGKIMLDEKILNDGKECVAYQIFNRQKNPLEKNKQKIKC